MGGAPPRRVFLGGAPSSLAAAQDRLPHGTSAMGTRLVDFVRASLVALGSECPEAYRAMCDRLGTREVELRVGGEVVALRFGLGIVEVVEAPADPQLLFISTRWAVLDLADEGASLLTAIRNGTVLLDGEAPDRAAFLEGVSAGVSGLVRSPSFPGLLAAYRGT